MYIFSAKLWQASNDQQFNNEIIVSVFSDFLFFFPKSIAIIVAS